MDRVRAMPMNVQVASFGTDSRDDPLLRVELVFMKLDWPKIMDAYLTDGTPLFTDAQKRQIDSYLFKA